MNGKHRVNLAELSAGMRIDPSEGQQEIIVKGLSGDNPEPSNPTPTAPTYSIDPRNVYNKGFEIINTTLENTSGGDLILILGTMAGDPANLVGANLAGVATFAGTVGAIDKAGGTAPFIEVLAKRLISQEVIIEYFSIFTDTSALGLRQRNQSINGIEIDYNTSQCLDTGRIPVNNQDVNAVTTVTPIALGPGTGIRYTILDGSDISIELGIAGQAIPAFN